MALGLGALACTEPTKEPTKPPTPPASDAGVAGNMDAQAPQPDAGHVDPDAGQIQQGTIQVIVQDNGTGIPGLDVLVSDDNGLYVSHHQTGSNGIAEIEIESNRTITVLARYQDGPGQAVARHTYVGINPGDVIRLGDSQWGGSDNYVASGTIAFSLPALTQEADNIVFTYGCDDKYTNSSTAAHTLLVEMELWTGCVDQSSKFNVLIKAVKDERPVAYAILEDIDSSVLNTQTTTLTVSDWQTNFENLKIRVKNPRDKSFGSNAELLLVNDDIEYEASETFGILTPMGIDLDLPVVRSFGQKYVLQVGTMYGGGIGQPPEAITMYRKSSSMMVPAELEVDMQAEVVPPIFDFELDKSTAPRWTIKWRTGDGNSNADAMFGSLEWYENNEANQWIIHMPPDRQGPWQLPEMPERFAQFRADSMDPSMPARIMLFGASFINGYSDYTANYGPDLFERMPPAESELSVSFAGNEF